MTNNIIFDSGGDNEFNISTTKVEEVRSNELKKLNPPTTESNYPSGAKDTILVNLLRIGILFNIDGSIAQVDRAKLRNLFELGFTFNIVYGDDTFTGLIEKFSISEIPSDGSTDFEYDVKITFVAGKKFGT